MTDTRIFDENDWCRACGGHGGHRELTERGTMVFEPCRLCGGSGRRSVLLTSTSLIDHEKRKAQVSS